MAVVTMRQLLESGVHFGHQTRRWNPKMKRFIMTERNGIYIIDLQQSLAYIDRSFAFIKDTVAKGGTIMFVGTKKQAQEAIAEQATRVGMPYVNQRWLGGMLTNFATVHQRINRLKELDEVDFDNVAGSGRTKKELLHMKRERDKLDKTLGGIREMGRTPSAVWIVDTKKEHLAVEEARKLRIPIIGILDTNCDPDEVDYPIPGNDDAIRAVSLLTRVVADAVAEGLMARSGAKTGESATGTELGAEEPLAEWERELLQGEGENKVAEAAVAATGGDTAQDDTPAAEATGASSESAEAPAASSESTEAAGCVLREHRGGRLRPPRAPRRRLLRRPRASRPETPAEGGYAGPRTGVPTATGPRPSHAPHSDITDSTNSEGRNRLMANISAADVKRLRDLTSAGMMDSKKALEEADGDFDKAVEILRVKGTAKAAKRGAERTASAGMVAHSGHALVELNCETDFVAKSDEFVAAAQQFADAADAAQAGDADSLKAAKLGDSTVGELVEGLAVKIGEKIELGRVAVLRGRGRGLHAPPRGRPAAGRRRDGRVRRRQRGGRAWRRDADRRDAPAVRLPRRRAGGDGGQGARDRRGDRPRGGQAGAGHRQDHRGPAQRLLQGRRAARPAVGAGQQEEREGRPRRGRCHREAVRPLRGRGLIN